MPTRRHRSLTFLAAAFSILLAAMPADAARRRSVYPSPTRFDDSHTQGGYASATSVAQGGSIQFHIATSVSPFTVTVTNLGDARINSQIAGQTSGSSSCSGGYATGCDWDVTTTFTVPASWPSGYYSASFPTAFGTRHIIFVVRAAQPGSSARILLVSPTHTYQAFNAFGGASLHRSAANSDAMTLSYDRPYDQNSGRGRFDNWERDFVNWMHRTGRQYEVATDVDLEDPTLLGRYEVVVLLGHSEYWTPAARQNFESYSRNGGHIAIFGGNTMWWQIQLAGNGRTIVGHPSNNPETTPSTPSALISTHWFSAPLNNPENRIIGTSFRNGGYVNKVDDPELFNMKPLEQRIPWTVTEAQHWIFSGTGLNDGDRFGQDVAGLEVDGVVFNCDSFGRVLGPDGSDETPLNYHILAIIPASYGWGTMGFYVNSAGGGTFNAAMQGWAWGLEHNDVISRMTANVLDRMVGGAPFPYDPAQTSILAQDLFNCPATAIAQSGWRGQGSRGAVNPSCAYEGPGGLELSGPSSIALSRSFAAAGQARDHAELRFYIKADDFRRRTPDPMPIVTLRHREGDVNRQVAMVELDLDGSTPRLRVARRGTDGGFAAAPGWLNLASGWHLVEVTWRSPGTITIQIDGGAALTLENPEAAQRVNEMVIEFAAANAIDSGRLCIDAIAVGSAKPGRVAELR